MLSAATTICSLNQEQILFSIISWQTKKERNLIFLRDSTLPRDQYNECLMASLFRLRQEDANVELKTRRPITCCGFPRLPFESILAVRIRTNKHTRGRGVKRCCKQFKGEVHKSCFCVNVLLNSRVKKRGKRGNHVTKERFPLKTFQCLLLTFSSSASHRLLIQLLYVFVSLLHFRPRWHLSGDNPQWQKNPRNPACETDCKCLWILRGYQFLINAVVSQRADRSILGQQSTSRKSSSDKELIKGGKRWIWF